MEDNVAGGLENDISLGMDEVVVDSFGREGNTAEGSVGMYSD
jgi:hypothetical protein